MYLELNSNNQVLGYSESESPNSVKTDKVVPSFTDTQILKFVDGDFVVEDSQALIDKKAEYEAHQYQRDRQYPSIGDQLDMQYHDQIDGTTTWKDAVAKVKADHPKPEQ